MYDAILFDFDGVLLDSEPVHFECWAEVLAPLGARLDWETYSRYCIGVSDRAMLEMLARRAQPPVDAELLWGQYPRKKERFRERMGESAPFPAGLAEFIAELALRFRLAVVSSSGRVEVEPLLERGGIRSYLCALVCGEDVERLKPSPEPYLLAARLLGASRPLVVEDSDAGMESAAAAGFDALRIADPRRTAETVRARLAL